jgi:hypothetical protein
LTERLRFVILSYAVIDRRKMAEMQIWYPRVDEFGTFQ